MRKKLLLMGANNPETLRLIEDINSVDKTIEVIGWLDNDASKHGKNIFDLLVIGSPEVLLESKYKGCFVFNNVTRNGIVRTEVARQLLGYTDKFMSLVHPSINTKHVKIGNGVCLQESAVVQSCAVLEDDCVVMANSVISHESKIGKSVFVSSGCVIAGASQIGDGATIWTGAIVGPRVKVGKNAVVGINSAVLTDVPDDTTVFGNPAKEFYVKRDN